MTYSYQIDCDQVMLNCRRCILNVLFLFPEIKCPAGMTYKSSTNACPNTCENQYAEDECHLSDRERCACPDGEFQRNGSCVATCGQQLQHFYHYHCYHYYISSCSSRSLQNISD